MKTIERCKFLPLLPPVSANNGAHSGNTYVDTQGWSHLRVLLFPGDVAAGSTIGSTNGTTAPYVEQSDATSSGYAKVTGAELASTISDAEDGLLFAIDIDLTKSHKRYMRVNAPTAGAAGAALLAIVGILSDKVSGPAFGGGATAAGLTEKISA